MIWISPVIARQALPPPMGNLAPTVLHMAAPGV